MDIDLLAKMFNAEDTELIKNLDFKALNELDNREQLWLKEKNGYFSASEFFRLMGYEDEPAKFPEGAMSYVIDKVLEIETESEARKLYSRSVDHGKLYEAEAVAEFVARTGKLVYDWGENQKFIKLNDTTGATPDGLIAEDEGIETKCPDSATHYKNLRYLTPETLKKMYPDYYWQIQGCMLVTNRKKWYFVSYDPRFKNPQKRMLIVEIERNPADIEKLKRRLFRASKELKKQLAEFNN